MSGKPIDDVVRALIEVAAGKVQHLYRGTCPDAIEGFDSRDPQCPACQVLTAAQQGQAVACVCCEDKPAPGNNPCGWCGRTAPPSAPVGVEGLLADLETIWHSVSDDKETNAAYQRLKSALAQQPAAVDEAQGEAIRARRQQIAGWLEGLGQAARSLRTIADQAGKVEGMEDMEGVRGYANSRATVAEAALATQRQEPKP